MGFWKNLFIGSESAPPANLASAGGVLEAIPDSQSGASIILSTDRDLDLYELEELCNAVGWARRPIRKVRKAIEHSYLVITMWEQRGNRRRLIGFSRATSDHAFNATIWDVVVHPSFQGRGLGKELMQQMIKTLRNQDVSNVTLFADPQVVEFYKGLGFMPDPEGIKGMFWYPD